MSENRKENFNCSSDLRLFLLGNIGCGKTSSANTILNQPQPSFRSADDAKNCKLREAFTEGRRVALVEAPRWYWAGNKVDDSIRKETEQAVTLMEPGPHAVLLLVPVNQFTEMESRVPAELQEMFGQEVLDHTLVVLTCGDYLMGRTVEEYLQREDPGLRQMIKACGGNVHVLNNRNPKDREQIRELLQKVDHMVTKKGVFNMQTAETRELKSQIEDKDEQEQEEDEEDEEEEEEEDEDEKYLELMQDQLLGRSETLALNRILGTSALEMVLEEEEEDDDDDGEEEEEEEPIIPSKMGNIEQAIKKKDGSVGKVQVPNVFPSPQEPKLQSHSESFDDPQLNNSPNADGALLSKMSEFITSSYQNRSSTVDGAAPQLSPVLSNPHSPIFSSTPQPLSNSPPSASVSSPSLSSSPSTLSPPELRLVLLGRSGAGKSSVGNSLLGQNVFRSEPDSFTAVTQKCEKRKAVVKGQKLAVVDTSDWFNSEQTPEELRAQISSCVALSAPGPHAFLLCVPLDQPAKTELLALEGLKKVFGPDAVTKHTIVLFTYADRLRDSGMIGNGGMEAYIADQRGDLLKLVEKCRDRFQIMERGQREKKSVADLFTLVALTMKEAGGQHFSSPAFLEAENKVKQKQLELARERELDQKTVRNDKLLSSKRRSLSETELNEFKGLRDEAEMSVSLTSIDCIPLLTVSDLSPSLMDSLKEKVESSMKMLPKLNSDNSVQLEETRKQQSSLVWTFQKMVADGSLWGKVGSTAGHVSRAVGDKVPKVVANSSAWLGFSAKAVAGSPVWEKLGAGTKTGAKLVANGSLRVGAGIGAGAKQVAQSPVWGQMGSGAKAGVTMVAESSLWERIGNTVRQIPKIVLAAGLLGLVLGVFFGGLFWGVVGATAGSAASEMGRQKFLSRNSSEETSEAERDMEKSTRNSADGGKSLKHE